MNSFRSENQSPNKGGFTSDHKIDQKSKSPNTQCEDKKGTNLPVIHFLSLKDVKFRKYFEVSVTANLPNRHPHDTGAEPTQAAKISHPLAAGSQKSAFNPSSVVVSKVPAVLSTSGDANQASYVATLRGCRSQAKKAPQFPSSVEDTEEEAFMDGRWLVMKKGKMRVVKPLCHPGSWALNSPPEQGEANRSTIPAEIVFEPPAENIITENVTVIAADAAVEDLQVQGTIMAVDELAMAGSFEAQQLAAIEKVEVENLSPVDSPLALMVEDEAASKETIKVIVTNGGSLASATTEMPSDCAQRNQELERKNGWTKVVSKKNASLPKKEESKPAVNVVKPFPDRASIDQFIGSVIRPIQQNDVLSTSDKDVSDCQSTSSLNSAHNSGQIQMRDDGGWTQVVSKKERSKKTGTSKKSSPIGKCSAASKPIHSLKQAPATYADILNQVSQLKSQGPDGEVNQIGATTAGDPNCKHSCSEEGPSIGDDKLEIKEPGRASESTKGSVKEAKVAHSAAIVQTETSVSHTFDAKSPAAVLVAPQALPKAPSYAAAVKKNLVPTPAMQTSPSSANADAAQEWITVENKKKGSSRRTRPRNLPGRDESYQGTKSLAVQTSMSQKVEPSNSPIMKPSITINRVYQIEASKEVTPEESEASCEVTEFEEEPSSEAAKHGIAEAATTESTSETAQDSLEITDLLIQMTGEAAVEEEILPSFQEDSQTLQSASAIQTMCQEVVKEHIAPIMQGELQTLYSAHVLPPAVTTSLCQKVEYSESPAVELEKLKSVLPEEEDTRNEGEPSIAAGKHDTLNSASTRSLLGIMEDKMQVMDLPIETIEEAAEEEIAPIVKEESKADEVISASETTEEAVEKEVAPAVQQGLHASHSVSDIDITEKAIKEEIAPSASIKRPEDSKVTQQMNSRKRYNTSGTQRGRNSYNGYRKLNNPHRNSTAGSRGYGGNNQHQQSGGRLPGTRPGPIPSGPFPPGSFRTHDMMCTPHGWQLMHMLCIPRVVNNRRYMDRYPLVPLWLH